MAMVGDKVQNTNYAGRVWDYVAAIELRREPCWEKDEVRDTDVYYNT